MIYSLGERRVDINDTCYVAPSASVMGSVIFGQRCSVWFNAVIRGDNDLITIGDGTNVQDGSILHVDEGFPMTLGENVTIGHKVMLHGCTVGDGSLIGMNAVVLNGAVIGKECLIGANALVTEGMIIPDRSLVLGSPAKVVKELTESHIERLGSPVRHYQEKIKLYSTELKEQTD